MATILAAGASLAGTDAGDPLADAAHRIEDVRMAPVMVTVTGADGRPIAGARVQVEQTRHAFLFGCNLYCWGEEDQRWRHHLPAGLQQAYRDRFAALFNFATLPFYWHYYEEQRGAPRHAYAAAAAAWCRENGITAKGHALLYNFGDPPWLPDDSAAVAALQLGRVEDCVRRFAGLIDIWDVVNEAADFGRNEMIRRSPRTTDAWKQAGQLPFAAACFRRARAAGPAATLLINDYKLDDNYDRVLSGLTNFAGQPLYDVVGLQTHQHREAWSARKVWDTCERFSRYGRPLHLTETTLLSGAEGFEPPAGTWPSTPEGERRQAEAVERFYTVAFSHPAVQAITWWDLADGYSWKGAPAGLVAADMTPKPAYRVLQRLLHEQWRTRTNAMSDAAGTTTVRGFLGSYRVTVTPPDGPPVTSHFELKAGRNAWSVTVGEPAR